MPDLPVSKSDDNVNLGDKDSIRRRALWALEGKPDVSYSKVEIPELMSPEKENSCFNFPSKPSYPPGGTGFSGGLNTLASKRDYMGSISSKDQLHTLVEEEEEEEEETAKAQEAQAVEAYSDSAAAPEPVTSTPLTVAVAKPSLARPRPATLNLRPLALTSGSVINQANGLPTPTLTPATNSSGLKSLALTTSPCLITTPSTNNNINDTNISMTGRRRQSVILPSPQTPPLGALTRRPSLNINCDAPSPFSLDGIKRQSSISYKSSLDSTVRNGAGLPTPIATPTAPERKDLSWSSDDEVMAYQRPLSASEQHFLFKSHNALLARITDLENALSYRSRSRPASTTSDVSSTAVSEPSNEMLTLIADLKAERDELKRDVDGWRTRVADLEDKVGILTKRVEAERREAWVARSRLGLLEIEKGGIEKSFEEKTASFQKALGKLDAIATERDNLKAHNVELLEQVKRGHEAEEECARLRTALEEERKKSEGLESSLDNADLLATPTTETTPVKRQIFRSMDSEASLTDVEFVDDTLTNAITLKAVVEEEEGVNVGDDYGWDEDNGLAGYEDEEDSDLSFQSTGGSSAGSIDEYPHANMHLDMPDTPNLIASEISSESASPSPAPTPAPSKHAAHNSLSKTWTFPSGRQPTLPSRCEHEEVDRFFGCLDDLNSSPTTGFMAKGASGKSLFSQGFGADVDSDDEMPPFVIPSNVGIEIEVPARTPGTLGVVHEEEEEEEEEAAAAQVDEDFDGEEFEGGIRFTFNSPATPIVSVIPPAESQTPLLCTRVGKPTPVFVPFADEEDSEVPFTFSKSKSKESVSSSASMDSFDSDMSFSARNFSPSSIPRSKALKSFTFIAPLSSSTPPKATSTRFVPPSGHAGNAFVTPLSKRGGTMPSMIPQPIASPLKTSAPAKSKAAPTLMRQPQRKTIAKATLPAARANATDAMNAPSRSNPTAHHRRLSSQMMTVTLSNTTSPHELHEQDTISTPASLPSIMSFQTLTNWWSSAPAMAITSSPGSRKPSNYVRKPNRPLEKKYISKEKQLEKLRSRLNQERKVNYGGHLQVDACKACGTREVSL